MSLVLGDAIPEACTPLGPILVRAVEAETGRLATATGQDEVQSGKLLLARRKASYDSTLQNAGLKRCNPAFAQGGLLTRLSVQKPQDGIAGWQVSWFELVNAGGIILHIPIPAGGTYPSIYDYEVGFTAPASGGSVTVQWVDNAGDAHSFSQSFGPHEPGVFTSLGSFPGSQVRLTALADGSFQFINIA